MQEILQKIQVHVPYYLLREKMLPRVLREGINPEIGFNHRDLDCFQEADFRETAGRIAGSGLSVTFHAPFMDLRPGALDPRIRQVSLDRLRRVFDLIPWFRPRCVVCHASFDERYYAAAEAQWLENSLGTWRILLDCVRETETIIALENVYERTPEPLKRLLDALASPQVRFCFDAGHANAFGSAPLSLWIETLGDLLGEIHIHDNHGTADEHLPVGEGNFPFRALFAMVRERNLKPILTVESHSEKGLRRMLENLRAMELLKSS
ncbi:MAG: sugar phosphate isomerase/epimerase [Deltaproteobacteria bacterium]|nr:sugar phosphate isomerase/epimerase [Deltaproteobacteria bacterium]